jgi:two-component system cell cycle response regulator
VVLPSTDRREAVLLGERLRKAIEKNQRDNRKITVSIGIAAASEKQPLHTPQSLVKEADDALYEAKASGKNRVIAGK